MYLIQNHHEAIIPRERFDAVQMELARRRAQTGGTKKSAPTGMSRYSGKYALSGLLFCGECGTAYRRVVWTQHGEKRAVWRCSSRLDYGKKYCKESPTLDETPLQQAVLAAINASMSGRKVLADQLVDAMEQELAPVPGESMSPYGSYTLNAIAESVGFKSYTTFVELFRKIVGITLFGAVDRRGDGPARHVLQRHRMPAPRRERRHRVLHIMPRGPQQALPHSEPL